MHGDVKGDWSELKMVRKRSRGLCTHNMQGPVGNGRALVAGIDPDPRETLRAIRDQLQIEQVHGRFYLVDANSQEMENKTS